jgi:hypothetical protein
VLADPPDRAVDLPVGRRLQQAQRRLAAADMDQAIADYQVGMSSNAVGEKYGIDGKTVLNNLKTRGITARPTNKALVTGNMLDRAAALRRQGWTYAAIGRELGVSRVVVTNALKRADRA